MSNVVQLHDVNRLAGYITGANVAQNGTTDGLLPAMGIMGGISGATWAYANRHDLRGGISQLARNASVQSNIVNSASKYSNTNILGKLGNKFVGAGEAVSKAKLEGILSKIAANPNADQSVAKYIQTMLAKGTNYTNVLNSVSRMQAVNTLNSYNAKVASQMANGSILRSVKNATGITRLSQASKGLAVKSGTYRTLLGSVKGNALFAGIVFGAGVLTDVVPAFKLGTKEGFKQLGKTTAKTGFTVGGWIAGSAVGAKIGAAVGSFCGPLGTVVGGAIGFAGGLLGSLGASLLSDNIFGKSEVELAKKSFAQQLEKEAKDNPEGFNQLIVASYQQLLQKVATGQKLTDEDKEIKKTLENIMGQKINLLEEGAAYNQYLKTQTA